MSARPISIEHLPESLCELVEAIGLAATLALVEEYGGVRCSVPQQLDATHRLAQLLGLAAARKLAATYGGQTLELPLAAAALRAARNADILARRGVDSASTLAREYRMTRRNVFLIWAGSDTIEEPNLRLFG